MPENRTSAFRKMVYQADIMDIMLVFSQMITLFILLAIGYICAKSGVLPSESSKVLSKLVLSVTMPCTALSSVMSGSVTGFNRGDTTFFVLMSFAVFAIAFIVAIPIMRSIRSFKPDMGLLIYMIAYSNASFMGFPVAQSVFGESATFFVSLFQIPFQLFVYSIGPMIISGKGKKISPRILLNPGLIAALLVFVIFLTGFRTPGVIANAVKLLGGATTPVAMIIIGSTLSTVPIKEVFSEWRLYPMVLLKLIGVPVVTWLILGVFVKDPLMLGVLVVISAMPTATTATMLAMEYGSNEKLAAEGVFLTTLLSVVTIPLIVYLLL